MNCNPSRSSTAVVGRIGLVLIGLCVFAERLPAETATIVATHDNTLYDDAAGALSNALGDSVLVGRNNNGRVRRGLLAFDLTSNIPVGARIDSAQLVLYMSQSPNALARDVSVHRALAAWGESTSLATGSSSGNGVAATTGDATWLHTSFATTFWQTPGGDFVANPSAVTPISDIGTYAWSSTTLADDVQRWLDLPADNFGWLLRGEESVNQATKRFNSREFANAALRPKLVVEYTPVPEPASWLLSALGCAGIAARRILGRKALP